MDRGVKIAIFVASIASLGLGLVWDQVLSHARVAIEREVADELAPEIIDGRMGSPDIPRHDVPEEIQSGIRATANQEVPTDTEPETEAPAEESTGWTTYTIRNGDSYWRIAHQVFKSRDLSSQDIKDANPGVKLVPGKTLQIPPGKDAVRKPRPEPEAPRDSSQGEWAEYEVREGDSWWKIAHVHFKKRNLSSDDIEKANNGVRLVPGKTVKIPPAK